MDYTIASSDDGTYIVITVKGTVTREIGMRLYLEANALGKQLHIRRYLTDVTDAKNTDSAINNYEFAYSDVQNTEGIDRYARHAILVSPDDHSHDFVETVSRNAGLDVRMFTDLDEAKLFLMEDDPPGRTAAGDDW